MLVDPSEEEDEEVDEDGHPKLDPFMPEVERFDPQKLATQADFIICLGGDGRWCRRQDS